MKTAERPTSYSDITPEQVEAWKKNHPKGIWEIQVTDQVIGEEEEPDPNRPGKPTKKKIYSYKKGFIRRPTREDLKYAMLQVNTGGPMAMLEAILEDCWLGGDQEILTEDEFFLGAMMQMEELMQVKSAELKKL